MHSSFRICIVSSFLLVTFVLSSSFAKKKARDPIQRAVCGKRSPCTILETKDAGPVGADTLLVVKTALHDVSASDPRTPEGECLPLEYWLVTRKEDGKVSARPLLHVCNDGYGSRMLGEDGVKIAPNSFTYQQGGGSTWMWGETSVVQLVPMSVTTESRRNWWTLGTASGTYTWRFTDWTGFVARSAEACNGTKEIEYAYQPIPRVALDPKFRASEWRTTSLGGCSTRIDSRGGASEKTPGGGFVVHGTPGDPSDATLRVLLSRENELFVEVQDDVFVPTATTWLHADHVELWLGRRDREELYCISTTGPLFQWGIDLQGKVYKAFGKPSFAPVIERAEQQLADGKKIMRFKLALPQEIVSSSEDGFEITVAYSDSDDGKQQERIIATSKITFGSLPTLGDVHDIRPEVGACRSEAGELRTVDTRVYDENRPVLGLE